jgi:RNA-binding protein
MSLTGKEKKTLKALGNKLNPEVWIGKGGILEGTLKTIENSFQTKDLLKIKVLDNCSLEVKEVSEIIARKTDSQIVQVIGNTILLYRPIVEEKL